MRKRRRFLIPMIAWALAGPALAQDYRAMAQLRDADQASQAEAARRTDVATANAAAVAAAQLQADQALRNIQATQARPAVPVPDMTSRPMMAQPYVTIPDATLAASNAAAIAASRNRR